MKTELNRCMGCMSEKLYEGPCTVCGYNDSESAAVPEGCLEPKTLISERFVVGKLLSRSGVGNDYIAYDITNGHTCEIIEFMPETLCRRDENGTGVDIKEGGMPLFKSYLSEFADLHKTLIANNSDNRIKKEFEIFAANGTGYVLTEHLEGSTLEVYLSANGGKLPWDRTKELFEPLFSSLANLHEKGIVHRGISPSTLFVTKDGRLVLTSIDISAARSPDSQIDCELFPGYAATEQYDISDRQGSWTDVYGISAVLYRVLTGIVPNDSKERKLGDTLASPAEIDEEIPAYVSDAVMEGLRISRSDRVHDMNLLRLKLIEPPPVTEEQPELPPEPDGPITPRVAIKFDPEETPERRDPHRPTKAEMRRRREKQKNMSNLGTIIGVFVFFALVAALVIAIIYFSDEVRSEQENRQTTAAETAVTTVPAVTTRKQTTAARNVLVMPDFVTSFYNDSLASRYNMLKFEAEFDYTDDYAENIIYEQDIPEGTEVAAGTTVHLKVSKGPAYTYLPDYVGLTLDQYVYKLKTLGIWHQMKPEETTEVKDGYVIRCDKNVGDKIFISKNEIVTIYYAVAPAVTTTEETTPAPQPEATPETQPAPTNTEALTTPDMADEIELPIAEE